MTQFDFYLNNLSFKKQDNITIEVLREKIEQFATDYEFIREQENERVYRHDSIYEEIFFDDYTVSEICNIPEIGKTTIGRDYQAYLQNIIHYSENTTLDNEEIIELLESHEENLINGILCLHKISGIDENFCVYDKNDWFRFHRYFFCIYPPTRNDFCLKASPYFPNLYFNPITIPAGLNGLHTNFIEIVKTIVHHLSALNDDFFYIFNQEGMSGDRACVELENMYRGHQVKIGASRDNNNLNELNFEFTESSDIRILYCDLHTKFYQYFEYQIPSYAAKGNRIYFHQPIENFLDGKVLIARIGRHAVG